VSFDGRSTSAPFSVSYGIDDRYKTFVWLNSNWQHFTQDIDFSGQDPKDLRAFQLYEETANNPDWEVSGIQVQALNAAGQLGGNLLKNDSPADWENYCAPEIMTPFYRLSSKDNTFAGFEPLSGIIYSGTQKTLGKYDISFSARSVSGQMPFEFGIDDHNSVGSGTLTTEWQKFTASVTVKNDQTDIYDKNRIFQIIERVPNNTAWEIRDISVRSSRSLPNMVQNQDLLSGSPWLGYYVKPQIQPIFRLKAQDSGCSGQNNGILLRKTLTVPGHYRLSFDGRSTGNSFAAGFGTQDSNMTNITLSNSWQTFSKELDLNTQQDIPQQSGGTQNQSIQPPSDQPAMEGRAFQINESAIGNPDWEVGEIKLQQFVNKKWTDNLLSVSAAGILRVTVLSRTFLLFIE